MNLSSYYLMQRKRYGGNLLALGAMGVVQANGFHLDKETKYKYQLITSLSNVKVITITYDGFILGWRVVGVERCCQLYWHKPDILGWMDWRTSWYCLDQLHSLVIYHIQLQNLNQTKSIWFEHRRIKGLVQIDKCVFFSSLHGDLSHQELQADWIYFFFS